MAIYLPVDPLVEKGSREQDAILGNQDARANGGGLVPPD
jgi:hypothetical protein